MRKEIHVSMFGAYETPKAHCLQWPRMFKHFSEMVQKLNHHGLFGILESLRIFLKSLKIQHTHTITIIYNNWNTLKKILVKFNHYRLWTYQNFEESQKNL
jgi:hypothetical protein